MKHHDQPMYRDYRDGTDMFRWLCAEPGCAAALSEETLNVVQDMAFADQHGIQLPGTTITGGTA